MRRHVHRRSRLRRVAAAGLAVVALGCSTPVGTVTGEGQVGAMPETTGATTPAPTPTASPSPRPTPTTPTATADPTPTPTPTPTPSTPTPSFDPMPAPSTLPELARVLGLDGLIDLLEQDPEAAGERGRDLLRELQRVAQEPERDRIDRALERLDRWAEDLDGEVAEAARLVLTDLRGSAAPSDGDRDDDDDDDDD